jgi:hypothetical protein
MIHAGAELMNAEKVNRIAQKAVVAACSLCVGILLARALGL